MVNIDAELATLSTLALSGDRVRIGWTFSNGRGDVQMESLSADDAKVAILALVNTAAMVGLSISTLTISRVED